MAHMYPKNIDLYNINPTERDVYERLKGLPDTYTVFHSVQWVDDKDNIRKESESDFLIFSDNDGFITCEVKGGQGYFKENDSYYLDLGNGNTRELGRSPMEQAEESSRYFYELYKNQYNENFNGIYGSISYFPRYIVDDVVLLDHRPKEIVLDARDNDDLLKAIRKAFQFYKSNLNGSRFMTKNQKENFKNMISKMIATKAIAGTIIEEKRRELEQINRIQDNYVYLLKEHKRTFITGGAGTGKTWIAYKFAKQALLENRSVLMTTFNEELCTMFKELLPNYNNLDILSFDELMKKDNMDCSLESEDLFNSFGNKEYKKYDCIIVDEAQDFDQFQAMIISSHLKNDESELRVFYDMTQNVLDKDFKDGFDIKEKPFLLRENLRNTESIYEWATEKTNLGKDVVTNQIIGPSPIEMNFGKEYDMGKYLETEILKLVDKENIKTNNMVILFDHDLYEKYNGKEIGRWICCDKRNNELSDNEIKISLVETYKGLESDIVFYLHSINTPDVYNYVAYTRARYYLYNLVLK